MKTKRLLLATIMLIAALTLYANPRSKQAIASAAAQVLNSTSTIGMKHAPRHDKLVELKANESVTVMGYQSGGYAIIGNDDLLPLVIGYSDSKFELSNTALQLYINALSNISSNSTESNSNVLDSTLYPTNVEPLISSHWTQIQPYNSMCPSISNSPYDGKAPTGCVATAMAQVIRFNHYPLVGYGSNSIIVPSTKEQISIDFTQSNYDFDNMLDDYNVDYNQNQKNAVSKLMLDCGVAANMAYYANAASSNISKGYWGLVKHFGYKKAVLLNRNKFSKEDWMNLIYNEIGCGHAIIYAGTDPKSMGGHCFVLDGYRNDGLIHINWGWGESNEGYYDLSILGNDRNYTRNQEMIIGLHSYSSTSDTIQITSPGTLINYLPVSKIGNIHSLKIIGKINSSDLKQIRLFAGRDSVGNRTNGQLHSLDLSDAEFIEDNMPFLYDSTGSYSIQGNILPERCFYNCNQLEYLALPKALDSIAPTALLGTTNLDSISSNYFHSLNNAVYNNDTTSLIKVFNKADGVIYVERSVTHIADHAMDGCNLIEEVRTYPLLESIGTMAFANMPRMTKFRISSTRLQTYDNVFYNLNLNCVLYTTIGLVNPWKDKVSFASIKEWGIPVFIIADNSYRLYGEDNPYFTYYFDESKTSKDIISKIQPYMSATKNSPVGIYRYSVNNDYNGFLDNPAYIYADEKMYIERNEAYIIIDTCYVPVGTQNPSFTYRIAGLQNGETDIPSCDWIHQPEIYTCDIYDNKIDADFNIQGQRYILTCYCESRNYNLNVVHGLAIVGDKETTSLTNPKLHLNKGLYNNIYNLQGMKVNSNYHGIVIIEGKKYIQ